MDYIPESLKNFLSDPNLTFVGVNLARDLAKLKNEYVLRCSSIADVRDLTLKRWPNAFYRKLGLKDVARLVVGLVLPKPTDVYRSDWQSRVLDDLQIEYACIDAYASFKIGNKHLVYDENFVANRWERRIQLALLKMRMILVLRAEGVGYTWMSSLKGAF
ncbi:hypothetical protein Dsin_025627 [Dipteronia sinensis]|uniref:3'-5' exonuclease domain-containing protein n=1 Tax=Dipteronia sinensis TaxID=43782 RepID=A0AAD9ZW70_9ROSI|nr:hypothetical protein Dsin_025627 [Dipteronia sinensis]